MKGESNVIIHHGEAAELEGPSGCLFKLCRHLPAGECMAGEGDVGEGGQLAADVGKGERGAGEVGGIGPCMGDVRVAGIGEFSLGRIATDGLTEPAGFSIGAHEIAGAQDDGAHALGGGVAIGCLHGDAGAALAGGGALGVSADQVPPWVPKL